VTGSSSGAASQKTENNQLHFAVTESPTIHAVTRFFYSSIFAVAALSGCAENQITGRNQLLLVSESQAISQSAVAYNQMMGDFGKKKEIETGTARAAKVREITNRLVAHAVKFRPDSANWKWEVQVVNDPKTVNAFCMAGGKMAIYTGMWEKVHATDDEIAEVMGHEISHALLNHTQERMSVALSSQVGLAAAAIVLAPRDRTGLALTGTAAAAALAIQLPNSRESESEADQVGIELAARAGYDPAAAVTLWDKMAKLGGQPPEFLSTHPSPEHRSARLKELGGKLQPVYLTAKNTTPPTQQYVK
jgi:predicted Zn-dependent protease